jgi:hypothetical protein
MRKNSREAAQNLKFLTNQLSCFQSKTLKRKIPFDVDRNREETIYYSRDLPPGHIM